MTNRFIALLAFMALSTASLTAQFEFGIKAGLATEALQGEQLSFNQAGLDNLTLALEEGDYGIQAGIFFRVPLGERLFLQPEVTFNSTEANFRFDDPEQDESFIFSDRYNNIDVPLLLGYKLGILKVQGGPVGHFFFDSVSDVVSRDGWDAALESFNLGYAVGGALDIGRFTIDVRYDGNLGNFGQSFTFMGDEVSIDQAAKRWVATVGYRF